MNTKTELTAFEEAEGAIERAIFAIPETETKSLITALVTYYKEGGAFKDLQKALVKAAEDTFEEAEEIVFREAEAEAEKIETETVTLKNGETVTLTETETQIEILAIDWGASGAFGARLAIASVLFNRAEVIEAFEAVCKSLEGEEIKK